MKTTYRQIIAKTLSVSALLVPSLAQAHPGHSHGGGIAEGLAHPVTGMDHVLAMVAVGLWAAQLGGRARWALPATFVSLMAAGAALGMGGISVPGIEQGIMASVLVLGLLVATAARLPLAAGAAIVGGFALFHGFAHGSEMPANANGLAFGAGFVFSTLLLHAVGLAIGFFAQASARTPLLRVAGLAVVAGALFV